MITSAVRSVFQKTKTYFPRLLWNTPRPNVMREWPAVLIKNKRRKNKYTTDITPHQTEPMARTSVAMTPEMSIRNVLIKKVWTLGELWVDSKCQLQKMDIFDSENWTLREFPREHHCSIKSQTFFNLSSILDKTGKAW